MRTLLVGVTAALSLSALAAPARAMHDSPAPVDEVAPDFSGHYAKPDIGSNGAARPWEAGPAWNR
jgi:hypothetical protein